MRTLIFGILIILAMLLVLGEVSGLEINDLPQTLYAPSTDIQQQADECRAFFEIKGLIQKEHIDFAGIKRIYMKRLQKMVRAMDLEFKLYMADIIIGAIEGGLRRDRPRIAVQIIDKTLQKAFFLRMIVDMSVALMGASEGHPESLNYWDEAWVHYLPLYYTVKTTKSSEINTPIGPTIHNDIIQAFMAGLEAIKRKDGLETAIQKEIIEGSLYRVFYNRVIEEVNYAVNKGPMASIHMANAFCFYSVIADKFEKFSGTNEINNTLLKGLSDDPEKLDLLVVKKGLGKGFSMIIKRYLKKSIDDWSNPNISLVEAWRGFSYLRCIEDSIGSILGNKEKMRLHQNMQEFVQAVKERDIQTSRKKARGIENALRDFENHPYETKNFLNKNFIFPLKGLRCANRTCDPEGYRNNCIGFRIVRDVFFQ